MTEQAVTPSEQPAAPAPEKVVAVRLKQSGKLEYFDARDVEAHPGEWLVVETVRGLHLGQAVTAPGPPASSETARNLHPVVRKATAEDIEKYRKWEEKSGEAVAKCKELARKLDLKMKPMAAHYNLDGSHLTIYFTADDRVDFRDLVKELRQALHARVELRQVGPRDEAKIMGALGKCGRRLCCMTFIDEFQPVSIRMAKDQDLSLNPMKVSGICGRLLCCLGYEAEHYRALREKSPKVGQEVLSPHGRGRVLSVNPLMETALIEVSEDVTVEVPLAQLKWEKKAKGEARPDESRGETGKGQQTDSERSKKPKKPPEELPAT